MKQPNPKSRHLDDLSQMFNALANSNRLAIVAQLLRQEMNVGDLATAVGLSQSALSQHLIKLKAAGLLQAKRDKQMQFYSIIAEPGSVLDKLLATDFLPVSQPIETNAFHGN